MNIRMFGHRCLVEHFRPRTSRSTIIIPDAAQQHDTHRFGKVAAVGNGAVKGQPPRPALVAVGDTVMFQINQVMENTQKFVLEGKSYMNLLQTELIGRLRGEDVSVENFEMLGDYVLLKHFFRKVDGSVIILPEEVMRQSAPDFIYFRVVLKGSTVDLPLEKGDEVVANLGRLTPLFFVKRHADGTSENSEYCYTHKDWVDGVVGQSGNS